VADRPSVDQANPEGTAVSVIRPQGADAGCCSAGLDSTVIAPKIGQIWVELAPDRRGVRTAAERGPKSGSICDSMNTDSPTLRVLHVSGGDTL
jgi:hypothetical protein